MPGLALAVCIGVVAAFTLGQPPQGLAGWILLWGGLWLALGLFSAHNRREASEGGPAQRRAFLDAGLAVAPIAAASALLPMIVKILSHQV